MPCKRLHKTSLLVVLLTGCWLLAKPIYAADTGGGPLPAGWSEWQDYTGKPYYRRPDGTTTWDRPPPPGGFIKSTPLPPGWKKATSETGQTYYESPDGTTTWDRPNQPAPAGGILGDSSPSDTVESSNGVVTPASDTEDPFAEESRDEGTLTLTKFHKRPIKWANESRLGGELEYRGAFFVSSDPNSSERIWNDLIFELFWDTRWNSKVRTYAKMELTGYLPQSDTRLRIIPEEAYLDLYLGPVDIRAGWQIYSWGAADLYNPTDRINPLDYTDILNYEKEGILSLKTAYSFGNWSLEGFWIPVPQESLLPKPGYRFFQVPAPIGALGNQVITDLVNLKPKRSLKNPQFGARLRGTAGRFDLSASYFYGLATVPQREVAVGVFNPVDNSVTITVNEIFPREHTIGANVATTLGQFALHLETAAVVPEDTGRNIGSADEFRFNYVVGGNYTFYNIIGDDDLRIFLDFTQELHQGNKSANLARIFQLSILGRLEYLFSDDLKFLLSWAFNFDDKDFIIRPRVEWNLRKGFRLAAGFDILGGPQGSFFNQFNEDDRAYLWLKYQF